MRTLACLSALLLASGSGTWAADLAKIDRTIHHELAYQSKAPKYCLLVFGPAAQTKVWLVVDGDTLYVDETGNGDLRVAKQVRLSEYGSWFKAGKIRVADNQTIYNSSGDWFYSPKKDLLRIDLRTSDGWKYAAFPRLADHPRKAPVVHFGGPLTLTLGRQSPKLLHPGDKLQLAPLLGTRGVGEGTFAAIRTIPGVADQCPQADIEFTPKRTTGAPIMIRVKFKWDEC